MERQRSFQQLKKPCIELLRITAALAHSSDARKELITGLSNLLDVLQVITSTPGSLDPKLAEYAFVPISQVLRFSQQVPVRALELCLQCISTLLRSGWGGGLEPALSTQLLILFTFLSRPSSAGSGITATSEELQSLALRCIAELLLEASRTREGKDALTSTANIPTLGEAVLVMLDSMVESKSTSVKAEATMALNGIVDSIADEDALASFFPRMVSSLTKLLTPSSSNRPSFRVVEQGLVTLSTLMKRLLSDQATKHLPQVSQDASSTSTTQVIRSTSWLHATASQVKIALGNVFRLRDHDKVEVRHSLLRLCLCIVQDCRTSLPLCAAMAIETAISLAGREDQGSIEAELKLMLVADQSLADVLRESLHGWIIALPRIMQSKDDYGRRRIINQISVALRLFEDEPIILDERLASSLRDGISAVLADSKGMEEISNVKATSLPEQALVISSKRTATFSPLRLRLKGQEDMMAEFNILIQEIAKSSSAATVLQHLVRDIDFGSQERRLASFWSSVNLLGDMTATGVSLDDFIDLGTPSQREELLDHVYAQSVTMLTEQDPSTDLSWQFYGLALETIAMQATRYKSEFRTELSDVLYPVLHHVGSGNDALRNHALTCLNIISNECGYTDAGELVVANADYIVNAVGLKLAIGDVSPQAPQVLLMIMRLCGPAILPYLDDLVGSIFDALERYHGYSRLTELLFSVLKGMTEEGVKAPQLTITEKHVHANQGNTRHNTVSMEDVTQAIKKADFEAQRLKEEDQKYENVPFPQEQWKKDAPKTATTKDDHDNEEQQVINPGPPEPPPPAPRTFDILLKISELTQHYLTTESPSLRTSLLSLLQTTIPALAKHENSFLPLINTLWPVLLPRLQDPEAFIVANALETISMMCEYAGDFMRSRIESAWDIILHVHRRTQKRDQARSTTKRQLTSQPLQSIEISMEKLSVEQKPASEVFRPELYVDAPTRMIWNSLVGLLCGIAKYVAIRDDIFDQVLDILDPVLSKDEVKEALEVCNADAVWLQMYKKDKRLRDKGSEPTLPSSGFVSGGTAPSGRPEWHFVKV